MSKGRLQSIDLKFLAWLFASLLYVSDLIALIKGRDNYVFYPLATFRCLILSDVSARMFRFPSALRIDCQQDDSTDSDTIRVESSTFTSSLFRCLAVFFAKCLANLLPARRLEWERHDSTRFASIVNIYDESLAVLL